MTTLEKIRTDVNREYKWLVNTNYTIRDIDIAFGHIRSCIDKYAEQEPTSRVKNELKVELNELEPCDDAISRQAVLDINESHHGQMPNHINYQIWQEIKELPSVRPQEKTGHWINKEFRKEEYVLTGKCSACGQVRVIDDHCSNCGARMFEPQKNEETAYEKCPICVHRNNSCLFGSPECNFEEEQ